MDKAFEQFLSGGWCTVKAFEQKSFNDLFTLEGMPLGYFLMRFFPDYVLPPPINSLRAARKAKKLSTLQKAYFSLTPFVLKKAFAQREKKKLNTLKNAQTPKKIDILLLSYTTHLKEDGSVYRYKKLIEHYKQEGIYTATPFFVSPLSNKKITTTFPSLQNYYTTKIDKKAKDQAKAWVDLWKKSTSKEKEIMSTYKQDSYWAYLQYPLRFFMSYEFLYSISLYYYLFKEAIKVSQVKAAVITGRGIFEKLLMHATHQSNIPCVLVQHGLIDPKTIGGQLTPNTHFAIWGELSKQKLVSVGYKERQLTITGPLMFEGVEEYIGKEKPKAAQKNILLLTQPFVEDKKMQVSQYFSYVQKVIKEIFAQMPNITLTIKLHPREQTVQEYEKIQQVYKDKITILTGKTDLYKAIWQSDLVLNFYGTTALLEAAILKKPSVTLVLPGHDQHYWGENDPSKKTYFTDNKFAQIIKEELEHPKNNQEKREQVVNTYCYKIDGQAAKRVGVVIASLIENTVRMQQ